MCVNSPATAASVIVTPSSTVRQMVSASRLAVAFKAGPGVFDARRRNLHLHTPQDPLDSRIPAPSANPRYALRIRKGPFTGVMARWYCPTVVCTVTDTLPTDSGEKPILNADCSAGLTIHAHETSKPGLVGCRYLI